MNRIPVVFCFDERIILASSVAISSLIDNSSKDTSYDIRIFHSDLSLKTQKNLSLLVEDTNHTITFHYINPKIFINAPCSSHSWTEIVYYRILVPNILKEYNRAIYSDVDVLFKDDLTELYNTNIDDYEIAMVPSEKNNPNYLEECTNDKIYFSGLILFNCKKYREDNVLAKMFENIEKYSHKFNYFDLDLINITCKKVFDLPIKYCLLHGLTYGNNYKLDNDYKILSSIYSDEDIEKAIEKPCIIHYAGGSIKPWRMKYPYEDYKKYMDNLPKVLKIFTFRDFRKKLFSKK